MFYLERATDEYNLTWTFVQDFDSLDKALEALIHVRGRNPDSLYRVIEDLDSKWVNK